jgi:DNA-binding CsgD family transcriptional regulator
MQIDELAIEMSFSEDQLTKQESEELNILKTQNGSMKKIGRKLKLI